MGINKKGDRKDCLCASKHILEETIKKTHPGIYRNMVILWEIAKAKKDLKTEMDIHVGRKNNFRKAGDHGNQFFLYRCFK